MPVTALTTIDELLTPQAFSHHCGTMEVVETHISWVVLTGSRAYKIKKPVNLGFVDFTRLADRRHYCEEEIRLNGRLAPDTYLGVVPITRTAAGVRVGSLGEVSAGGGSEGQVIDYAVCMRQFNKATVLNQFPLQEVTEVQIDRLADDLATFHINATQAPSDENFGTPKAVWQPINDNFELLQQASECSCDAVRRLRTQAERCFDRLAPVFRQRRDCGCVRECHGDLHLGNMFLSNDRITVFDGIEFNDSLRWIDVASDLAFLMMDLEDHQQHRFAGRLLNRWLERTGDYDAMSVMAFYCSYRAAVRAKVNVIRMHQTNTTFSDQRQLMQDCQHYLQIADDYLAGGQPTLTITMGVSGSGKTTASGRLIENSSTIRIRSDVERKRMNGLAMEESSSENQKTQMYSPAADDAVYGRLEQLAATVLNAGCSVVVDATFLKRRHRDRFARLASRFHVPFQILHCQAEPAVLRERIQQRQQASADASEADLRVLDLQFESMDQLTPSEIKHVTACSESPA